MAKLRLLASIKSAIDNDGAECMLVALVVNLLSLCCWRFAALYLYVGGLHLYMGGGGLCIAINVGERLKEEMIIPEAVPGRVFN